MLSRNFQLVTEAVRSVFHVVSVSSKVSVEELALSALALQKIMAGQNQENDFQSLAKKVLDYACGRNYFREHDLEYLKKFYHSEAKVVDQNFLRSLVGALLKLEKFKVAKKRYETARLISQKITVEQRELLDLFIVHERDVEEYGAYLKTLVLYGESGTEDATLHSSKNADKVRMQELRDPRMSLLKIARYCSERYLDSSSGESWVTNCFFKVLEIERVWVDAFLLHVEYFSRWVSECGVSVIVSRACEDGTPTAEQFYGDGKTLSVFILLLTKFVNLLGTSSQKTFILSVVERSLRRQLSHFSTGKYTVDEKTMFLSTIWINFATRTFSHLIEALEVLGKTGTAYTLLFHYFDNLSNVDSPFIIHQDMISFEIEWLHVMNIFAYRKSSLVEVSQALSPLGEQRRFSIIVNNVVRQYKELLAVFCQDVHYSSEIVKELISEFTSFIGICYMTNEGCLFQVTRSQGVESPLAEMYQSTLQAWKDSAANSQFFTNLLNILDCFMVNMARFLRQVFQSSIWSVGDAYLTATAAMISAFLAALNQMSYLDDENVKWIVLRHKRTVLEFHKLMSGREILILFSKKKLAEEIFYGSFTCELTEQTEFLESFRSFLCEYVANESDEYSHTILSSMLQIIMSAKIIIEDDSVNFERSSNCFVASVDFLDEILDSYISSLTVCPSSVHLKLVENEGIYLLSNGILRLEEEKAALANEDHCKKCSSLNRKLQVILKIFFSNETAPLISLYSDRVWRIFIMFLENEDTSDLGKDLLRRIFLGADEQENLLDLPKDFTLSETRKHCRLLFQGLLDRLEFHCFQDSVGAERKALLLRKYLSLFSSLVAESMRIMQRMFRNSRGFEIFKAIFSDSDSDFVRSIAIDLLKLLAQVTRNNPKAEFELKSLFPCNFLVHTLNSCYPEGVSSEVIAALLEVVVGSPILIRHNSDNFQCMTSFVIENVILSQDRLAFRSRLVSSSSEILCALFKLAESTSEDVQVALCNFIYTITYEDSLNASVVDASGVTEIIIERLFYSSVDSTFWSSLHLRNAYLSCLCAIIRHLVTPSMLSRLLSVSYLGSSSQFGLHDKRTLLYSEVAIFHALSESFEICKKWPRFFLDFSGNHSGLASIIPGADLTRRKDSLWLTFWFRRETISRESSLVELYTSKDSAFEVFLNELGVLCLRLHESETVFEMFHNTDTEIPPYVWVFVCLRFQRISSGKQTLIDVYLNGKLSSSSNVSKNIDRVTAIGFGCSFSWTDLSILPRASSCLKGQFGAIYCFQGNLSERTICTIYEFGPSFDSDLCDLSFSESTRDLDNLLNLSVLFLYAPRCCGDSRTCPDGSLAAVGSRKSIAARLIGSSGESRVCSVNNIIDSLHCVGGLRSVLELFFALDNFSSSTLGTDETEADSVSADVLESLNELTCYFLKIIAEILRYDKQAEIEWMNTHVFDYLGAWFFETKLSFSSKEVIDAIFQLFETCSDRKSVVSVCTKRCLSNEFLWSKMTQDVAVHFWKALCSLKDNSTLSPNVLLDVIGNFDVDSAVFVSRESRDISLCKGIIDFILLGFKMLFTNSDFVTSGNQFLVIDGATQRDGVSYLEQIEHAYSRALVENLLKPVCFHALDEMNQDAFAKLNYLLQALSSLSNFLSVSVRASCFSFLIHQDLIEVLLKVLKSTSQLRLVLFSIAALFDLFESNSDECVQWVTSQFRLSELSASMEKEEWKNHVIGGLCMFITGTLQGADADLTMLLEHLMSSDFLGGPCSTQGTIEKIRTGALPLIIMLLTKENNLIGKASMIQALVALLEESRQLTETFLCFNLWSFWIISLSRVNTFSTCDEDELFSSYVSSFKKLVVHLFKHFIEDWGMSVTTFYQVEELVFAAWNLIDATFAMQVLTWFLQCVKDIAVPLLLSQGIFGMNIGAKCSQTLESTNIEGFAMVFLFTKLICDMGNMQNAEAKQKDTRLKLEMCELCIEIILLLGLLSTSSASYSGESKVVGNDFEFLGIHVFPRSAVLDLFGKYENERRYPASRPGQNSFKLDEQTFIEPLCKGGFVRISLLFIIDALVEKLKLQEEFSYYETLLSSIGEVHGGLRVDKIWRHYVEQHFTNLISESTPNPSEISQKNELELLLGNLVKRWKQSKHSVEHKSTGFFRPFKNKSLGRNMQVLTSPTAGSEMIASLMKSEQEWNETGYACMFSAVMEWKKRVDQSFDILENISTVLSSNTHIQKDVLREVNVSEGVRNDAKSRLKASEFRKLVFGFRKHLSYQELMKDSTKTQWSLAGIMDSLQRRWLLKPTENIDTQWKRLSQSAQQMSSLSNYSEEGVTSPSRDSVTDANQKRNSDVTTITGPHLSLPVDNLSIQQFDESYQKNWSIESPEPSSASPSSSTPLLSSMELLAARTAASASDVQWSGSCIWVRFLKAVPGRLELRERSIRFLQSPFNEESERVLSPGYFVKTSSTEEDIENIQELTFPLEEIQHLEFRRFLLQHKAFEIFLQNKKSYFFALQTSRACKTCLKLLSKLLELPHNRLLPSHNTSGPRSVYAGGAFKFPRCLLDWKTVQALTADACARWKRRQLSNFEYLCILNRLAGRSNNDLCQYPIFPWILADYSTEKLDLTDPKTFRDLAKPVGCQPSTSSEEAGERERRFRERFETWADKAIPPFHYGSHYSSAAAALHYLVRVEPFTTLSLELQGGLFDHPDRMFYSLEGAWNSVTQSMQDVKELIPEFFYFPEIFRNRNGVSFGRTQDGHLIDDVLLPKWANGSPEHFVRVHREALESEYVSLNLHHWIDLIFGFRQRGPAAVEACNVFFYLTYEGAIDLESIQDMELRESMETQIAHFGQTPPQLMEDSGHPQRDHSGALLQPSYWTPQGLMAALEFSVAIGTDDSIVQICQAGDRIVSITKNQFVFRHKWIPLPDLQGSPFTFETDTKNISESAAFSSQEGNIETRRSSNREIVGGTYLASSTQASLFSLYALSFDGKVIISAGHWDWSIRCCFTSEAHKPIQCLKGHRDIVTCLSIGSDGRTLVTGSKDTTIFVWEIVWGDPERVRDPKEGKLDRSYSGGETKLGAILKVQGNVTKRRKMKVVEERPKLVLYEHEYPLVCVAVNTEVGVIASNDSCNTLMIHNLSNGHLLRILDFLKESLVDSVTVTCRNEIILVSSKKASFFLYTGNGVALKKQSICSHHDSCQILSSPTITSYTITVDGRLLFVADELNGVAVYSSWGLNLLHRYVPCPSSPVNALCLTAEESILLAGLSDGRILAYTVDRFALLQSSTLLGVEGASNPFYGC